MKKWLNLYKEFICEHPTAFALSCIIGFNLGYFVQWLAEGDKLEIWAFMRDWLPT